MMNIKELHTILNDEVKKMIKKSYNLLSVIPVNGDNVEVMAEVREILRKIYQSAGDETNDG